MSSWIGCYAMAYRLFCHGMQRTMVKLHRPLYQSWRSLTDDLGYGERGMMKLLEAMLDHAQAHPEFFQRR